MRLSTALAESSRFIAAERLAQLREDDLDAGLPRQARRRPGRPDRRGRAVQRMSTSTSSEPCSTSSATTRGSGAAS